MDKATGGSNTPPKSAAHADHAGSSAETFTGMDSCGVQILAKVRPRIGSNSQLAVQIH